MPEQPSFPETVQSDEVLTWIQGQLDQGRLEYRDGQFDKALACLMAAHERCTRTSHRDKLAEIANDIGVIYTVKRRWAEAEKFLNQAQHLFMQLGDDDGQAQTLGNLGSMFRARGDWQQAAAHLQLAADRFQLVGDTERRAATLTILSITRLRQWRFIQALAAYEAALSCRAHLSLWQRFLRWFLSLPRRLLLRG